MSKNLKTDAIVNELQGASFYFQQPKSKPQKTDKVKSTNKPVERPVSQSTSQQIKKSTKKSMGQSTLNIDDIGAIVVRPKSFYITERLDKMLDEGVKYLQDQGIQKVDRSVLINALLHDPKLFTSKKLDGLRNRILTHLTNKALKRG